MTVQKKVHFPHEEDNIPGHIPRISGNLPLNEICELCQWIFIQ